MTRTIEDLIPDYIRGLPVYVPGRPIEEVERELKIHAVKLASNENPLGTRGGRDFCGVGVERDY
jgi:histidinol-phosphate/aromatic aminotransferase/cobyric acid decarboxylase-like protein